ncbi:MAG TPA: MarR family transcriptional regulator [Pseudonocardiaceae bacterium]|nr:MarR family transcriptional regulator [Pseudonocardiaceae bacterium]
MTESRDEEAVQKFVERFASDLSDNGFPRMPARVFAVLLVSESGQLTAAELADALQVSPAAISGAVRYLVLIHFVTRAREAGSRRDVVRVSEHNWMQATLNQDQVYARMEATLREGVAVLGADSAAGARVEETRDFFSYLRRELPQVLKRWQAQREQS